jgi:hypothetical protein
MPDVDDVAAVVGDPLDERLGKVGLLGPHVAADDDVAHHRRGLARGGCASCSRNFEVP